MRHLVSDRVAWSCAQFVCLSVGFVSDIAIFVLKRDVKLQLTNCLLVCQCVFQSVTLVSSAKTAAPIEMPFGLGTWVDPRNHVLDGGSYSVMERDSCEGRKGAFHCKV